MLKFIFNANPSKFGSGVGLLWRGNRIDLVNQILRRFFFSKTKKSEVSFLFESGRSAIYNLLASQDIGEGDEVVISAFTCEAVPNAVIRAGACPVYVDVNDDLTMCDEQVLAALTSNTRAVIIQNTLGRLGLRPGTINLLRRKGVFLIEDCALSIGSERDRVSLGTFGDISIWSMEVSKTITIGWGGVAKPNCLLARDALMGRYSNLGSVSMGADIRRLFQLWFSLLMVRFPVPGATLIWYFFYGTRIFRRSNRRGPRHPTAQERMGFLSTKLFDSMEPSVASIYEKTNRNYLRLENEAQSLKLDCPIIQSHGERVVAPRFSILVNPDEVEALVQYAQINGIEVGRWFSDCPPKYQLRRCRVHGSDNARRIGERIVNFPCHWSLEEEELEKIKTVFAYIAGQRKVVMPIANI